MKLTYRGVSYDYTPPAVEMKAIDEVGKFRGVDIRFRTLKKAPVQQATLDLIYRGVAYSTGTPVVVDAMADVTPDVAPVAPVAAGVTVSAEDKARLMMMNRHRSVKQRQQSMLARLAAEAGLPADAAKYWNHIQGKVHPSFWATYSRSAAAVS